MRAWWVWLWVSGLDGDHAGGARAQDVGGATDVAQKDDPTPRERRLRRRFGPGGEATKAKSKRRGRRRAQGKGGTTDRLRPMPAQMRRFNTLVGRGRYRQALVDAAAGVELFPDNGHLHGVLAVSCAFFGDYWCVEQALEGAGGVDSLTALKAAAEADALRALGHPRQAAELRRTHIVSPAREDREVEMLVKLVGDHLAAGDLEDAHATALEALALAPGSPEVLAELARVATASGDLDAAGAHLWLAERGGGSDAVLAVARAELQGAEGDRLGATLAFDDAVDLRVRSMDYSVARIRVLLAAGQPFEALDAFDLRQWFFADELWHPELMGLYAVSLAQTGHSDLALAYANRLAATYPPPTPAHSLVAEARRVVHSRD